MTDSTPSISPAMTEPKIIAKHLFISGKVQGVAYRYHMSQKANALEVEGWCQNLPDGRVEAMIRGEEAQVSAMIEWAKTGSPRADVDKVEYFGVLENLEAIQEHNLGIIKGFQIL
jgi:acylphosphatase